MNYGLKLEKKYRRRRLSEQSALALITPVNIKINSGGFILKIVSLFQKNNGTHFQ